MKKLKRIYTEHRVFAILMALVIVCFVLIGTILVQCFYVGGNTDKYGDRLAGIEKVKIDVKEVESKIVGEEIVKKCKLSITGRIVYASIYFEAPTTLVEAQTIAQKSLDYYDEEQKKFYDFHFTLKEEATEDNAGFIISGARNRNGSGLVWNNNNPVTVPEETNTEGNGE